jgi:bleomycin hydrolase
MRLNIHYKEIIFLRLLNIFAVVALFLLPAFGFSQLKCEAIFYGDLFQDTHNYGNLKKDFKLDPTYKVLVPEQSDIKNQCNLGTCHLHSWASMLEHDFKQRTNQDMKISTHYLSVSHWLSQSLDLLANSTENQATVQLGANVFTSRRAILKYGIIPDEIWTGIIYKNN